MEIKANEISVVLKHQIEKFQSESIFEETGEIVQLGDGIARIYGLDNVMSNELLEFTGNIFGMALNLEEDNVGCILFGDERLLKQGDMVKRTGKVMQVPAGESLTGRVVNPLGQPIDGKGPLHAELFLPLEQKAVGVVERQPVKEPLQTGIKAIDSMIPIGRGQRELIIGDRQIGKSTLAIDTIINQRTENVHCIYVAIGQKSSTIAKVFQTLSENHAMEYTTIIAGTANDPAPLNFIAPYAGAAMGEYFRDKGMHSLVVYDDLSKHAWAYRQVSLLLRRPPGREAYPGDIFYLHSRLLERAAKLNDDLGGGSMTALPIIETQGGDFSAYIPTNVISITDGQIYLEPDLFYANIRPAINIGLSVSRVGGNAQIPAMKKVAGKLRLELAQYRELEGFAKLSSEVDKSTRDQLNRGQKLVEMLKQLQHQTIPIEKQIAILFLGTQGYLDEVDINDIGSVEAHYFEYMDVKYDQLLRRIKSEVDLSEEMRQELEAACKDFTARYRRS